MTDLKDKTIKELRTGWIDENGLLQPLWEDSFDEIARRLEETQQKLETMRRYNQDNISLMHEHANRADALEKAQQCNEAHDAEVVAKALDETANEGYAYYARDMAFVRLKAAEYRAKANKMKDPTRNP